MINSIQQPQNNQMTPSASAVNIQIFNPQAYAGAPSNPPVQYRAWNTEGVQQSFYDAKSPVQYPKNYNNTSLKLEDEAPKNVADEKNLEEVNSEAVKPLTDEDIKSMETALNDSDPKVRLMGAKNLLETFKGNSERANNPSLIALLNKTLQDETASVRFVGLTTLDVGYTKGNEETIQILNSIKDNQQEDYAEDSLLAQQILANISAGNVK